MRLDDAPPPRGDHRGMSTALHKTPDVEVDETESVGSDGRSAARRMALSFCTTMIGLRAVTFGQRSGILPLPDVAGDGIHVHHFVWGITILGVVGFCGLMSPRAYGHPFLTLLFGVGLAMVVDEFALWLTLRDVYFAPEGAWSVMLAVAVGAGLAAHALWRSLGLHIVVNITRTPAGAAAR